MNTVVEQEIAGRNARIQVWGKGYRVSEDTEEFQRYVPIYPLVLESIETRLEAVPWGRVLEPLYSLSDQELGAQRCAFFDSAAILAICFARTTDKHGRASILVIGATVDVDWRLKVLGEVVGRVAGLASRLSETYASQFSRNPENIGNQLRSDLFLTDRSFDIALERSDVSVPWAEVMEAVKRWRGVTGICTPKLLDMGANVLLGTQFEADRAQTQRQIAGYFDMRDRLLRPLSDEISLWETASPDLVATTHDARGTAEELDLKLIHEAILRLETSIDSRSNQMLGLLERLLREKKNK